MSAPWKTVGFVLCFFLILGLFLTHRTDAGLSVSTSHAISTDSEPPELPTSPFRPLAFVENRGQFVPEVRFRADAGNATLWFTSDAVYYQLTSHSSDQLSPDRFAPEVHLVKVTLSGAERGTAPKGESRVRAVHNYFVGNDPAKWYTDVSLYQSIVYPEVYPGIDLTYYGNGLFLEYDFVVSPGANPSQIALTYEGVSDLSVKSDGSLHIATTLGSVTETKPLVYQEIDGERRPVEATYQMSGDRTIRFVLANYDRTLPVVIDPVIRYSTFLGGSSNDFGRGVALTSAGNPIVTGYTASTNFPVRLGYDSTFAGGGSGSYDGFISKFTLDGDSLVYSTFFGGATGEERSFNIAVDASDNAYVTGSTGSTDFPTASAFQGANGGGLDAFLFKLSAAGNSLLIGSYLGGSANDEGVDIAVSPTNQAHIAGYTFSGNFPTASALDNTLGGTKDGFVTKFSAAGTTLSFSTYFGGSAADDLLSVALDKVNDIYVAGSSLSNDIPKVNSFDSSYNGGTAVGDATVVKLTSTGGAISFSSYLGTTADDGALCVGVDTLLRAYVGGYTASSTFPRVTAADTLFAGTFEGFVTRFGAAGTTLSYSTFVGGTGTDFVNDIAIDNFHQAYITGNTASSAGFPLVAQFQSTMAGASEAFVSCLANTGSSFVYSSYLGGQFSDFGYGIDILISTDSLAYISGYTGSNNFPVLTPYQQTIAGNSDAFLTKISTTEFICFDTDSDGFGDPGHPENECPTDNCPADSNPSQADGDSDGIGTACDNCPVNSNASQADADSDGIGDACDICTDTDGDGFGNPGFPANTCPLDNCPTIANVGQANADGDSFGDVCDLCTDTDADGFGNPGFPANTCPTDNCPTVSNPTQTDTDGDGLGNSCDNCPTVANANQANADGDSFGDVCDLCTDTDGDGFGNPGFPANTCPLDNCPIVFNPTQSDSNFNGIGDACDAGCCVAPIRGNVNNDVGGNVTVADLTFLVAFLFNSGTQPACPDEGNVNGSPNNSITVADLTYLVGFLFNSGPQPPACP